MIMSNKTIFNSDLDTNFQCKAIRF